MRDRVWSWPIACYMFLGGLGSSMAIVATVAELAFGMGAQFVACVVGSVVAAGLGCLFLVFELGRPLQAWRAFSKQHAVLTFGTWSLTLLLVCEVAYFTFLPGWFPWSDAFFARKIFAALVLIFGCCVLTYTGVELASMRGRVFWNTPALPLVFVLSGLLNGTAATYLLVGVWPWTLPSAAAGTPSPAAAQGVLASVCITLGVLNLLAMFIYVFVMYAAQGDEARVAAARWLKGEYATAFWLGLVLCCLLVPIALFITGISAIRAVGAILFIVGGLFVRFLFVFSDDRRSLPGMQKYADRLPTSDDAFMKKDW